MSFLFKRCFLLGQEHLGESKVLSYRRLLSLEKNRIGSYNWEGLFTKKIISHHKRYMTRPPHLKPIRSRTRVPFLP